MPKVCYELSISSVLYNLIKVIVTTRPRSSKVCVFWNPQPKIQAMVWVCTHETHISTHNPLNIVAVYWHNMSCYKTHTYTHVHTHTHPCRGCWRALTHNKEHCNVQIISPMICTRRHPISKSKSKRHRTLSASVRALKHLCPRVAPLNLRVESCMKLDVLDCDEQSYCPPQ
jgi:hypothetical protein